MGRYVPRSFQLFFLGLKKSATSFWLLAFSRIRCILGTKLRANGYQLKAAFLPPIMRERVVGLRHAVDILLLLDCGAALVGGVVLLACQCHVLAFSTVSARIHVCAADSVRLRPF